MKERKYYIDWIRVIAIGLLLIYHIVIMYQPFAKADWYIQSPDLLTSLWFPMSFLNNFRVPLLFFVSGMGVYFSIQKRDWKDLIGERAKRILVPFIFGVMMITPIHIFLFLHYNEKELFYAPVSGHLWFLKNIFIYVLLFFPLFFYIKNNPENKFFRFIKTFIGKYPIAIYLLILPYILSALTIPEELSFTRYTDIQVGFIPGAIAFFLGFVLISLGNSFWASLSKVKYHCLSIAVVLFLTRWLIFGLEAPHVLRALESASSILAVFGLGYTFLNKKNKTIKYLSTASYPIYILHMIFLFLAGYIIFPLELNVWLGLFLIIAFTFSGAFLSFEIIKRISYLRPLLGMK